MNTRFDAGHLIDAVQTGALPSCTIKLKKDDFVALLSWTTIRRFRGGHPATKGAADYGMNPALGLLTLRGPNGSVVVKADDIPIERMEPDDHALHVALRHELDQETLEPSASVTKRLIDERPVEPSCTCGGRACGTTCSNWCDTRRK